MSEQTFDLSSIRCLIDLHLHLDGALSIKTVRQLAEMNHISVLESDEELLDEIAIYEGCKDLTEYLKKFAFPIQLLSSKEALSLAVYNLLEECMADGIIYAEVKIGPTEWAKENFSPEEVVLACIDGLNKSSLDAGLIACCMRGDTYERNMETLRLAKKYLNQGIVAVDLAGAEALYPNEDYKYVFDYALENNIPLAVHSGEAAGAESVRTALAYGADKRIGHGIHSYEDEELMDIIKERNIILEFCPTSNIDTNIFESIHDYPLRKYLDKGIKVTINSDDPTISRTSLRKEWQKVIDEFDLSKDEVKQMLLNSVEAAYCSEEKKEEFRGIIERNFSEDVLCPFAASM